MRAFAITGIDTASWISAILVGSAIRATPPSRRMSAGTRSSAITDAAPASSAMRASWALTTSMITPPLSISARPALTRNVPVSFTGAMVARRGRNSGEPGENSLRDALRYGRPDPVRRDPPAVRRVLPLAEGRRPVHRGPSRGGGLSHGGGARTPGQHLELYRRALRPGPRLRGVPGAPGRRPRRVPAPARERRHDRARPPAPLPHRPNRVRGRPRRRPRERRGDRPPGGPRRGGGRRRPSVARRAHRAGGHRPDGVLRLLPPPPADAARPASRGG